MATNTSDALAHQRGDERLLSSKDHAHNKVAYSASRTADSCRDVWPRSERGDDIARHFTVSARTTRWLWTPVFHELRCTSCDVI